MAGPVFSQSDQRAHWWKSLMSGKTVPAGAVTVMDHSTPKVSGRVPAYSSAAPVRARGLIIRAHDRWPCHRNTHLAFMAAGCHLINRSQGYFEIVNL